MKANAPRAPSLRIVGGAWRGRTLAAPPGTATRPTADRVRQALFDMLAHAPWSPGLADATVLDAFAGSGALALEALSRGAAHATLFDTDRVALATIRANIAACRAGERATALPADATTPPRAPRACGLVFLDPPYAAGLIPRALAALATAGWVDAETLLVAETARDAAALSGSLLADRVHGAARLQVWRGDVLS